MEVRPQPDEGERLALEHALRGSRTESRGASLYRSAWRSAGIDESARRGLAELPRVRESRPR